MNDKDCIFCRILAGDSPASFVHRDDICSAFMDIQPINPGHLLVIPNRHATFMADVDGDTMAHIMKVGHRLAAALRHSGLECEGVNLFLADGAVAGQEVFHVHLHVIPRFRGDDFRVSFGSGRPFPARSELDSVAEHIQKAILV